MISKEVFDQFTVYKEDDANSFLYAHFEDTELFMNGLADYILSEDNLLNYANTLTKIPFVPESKIYRKLYRTINIFLNSDLELLTFDEASKEIRTVLGEEYQFIDVDGETLIQKDKIGKIGEYTFHLLLTNYFKLHCIIPKFRCTTNRNMSVFGIDALYFDPTKRTIYFGESKVSKDIDNAIKLVNESFSVYEKQIAEEYKLVLSDAEIYNLSEEFLKAFQDYTERCVSFKDFIRAANVTSICIPAFLAHGNGKKDNSIDQYLKKMNSRLRRKKLFNLQTEYIFISLPIIDKAKMMDVIMKKVVQKNNEYQKRIVTS